ncbi:hypothetical protein AAY473_021653, partial [Plecturocebus cupreus]
MMPVLTVSPRHSHRLDFLGSWAQRWGFATLPMLALNAWAQVICLPQLPKVLELQTESHSVTQAEVKWCDLSSLQPPPSGF